MPILKVNDFSLKHTLECGQFFRYHKKDGWYYVQARNLLFKIQQKKDRLEFQGNVNRDFIIHFFRLDDDYADITDRICRDPHVAKAVKRYRGLRLIRQDPWECMISYVCSSASNIPKIKKNITLLSEEYGDEIQLGGFTSHTFPEPKSLKHLKRINACKVGYRDRFIFEINKRVDEQFFRKLKRLDYTEAKTALKDLPGIGDKIADCIMLFSLGHLEAFPIDTWVRKIMQKLYFRGKNTTEKKIREFALKKFGSYAGYAQEYLFYYARMDGKEVKRHAKTKR